MPERRFRALALAAALLGAAPLARLEAQPAPTPPNVSAPTTSVTGPATFLEAPLTYTGNGVLSTFTIDPTFVPQPGPGGTPSPLAGVTRQLQILAVPGNMSTLPGYVNCPDTALTGTPVTRTLPNGVVVSCGRTTGAPFPFGLRVTVTNPSGAIPSQTYAQWLYSIPASASSGTILLTYGGSTGLASTTNGTLTVTVPPIAPTLSYAPSTGTTITFPVQNIGTSSSQTIDVTASGGQGGATRTLTCPANNAPLPQGFSVTPGTQTLALGNAAQDLTVTCLRAANALTGTLTCSESTSTGSSASVSWPLSCPAGLLPDVPPTLAYNPGAGTNVNLSSGPIGQTATGAIAINPTSPGSGAGSVALACSAAAGIPQVIYADGLQNGWSDFAFGGGDNFNNTSPVFSGTQSISFDGNNFNALAFGRLSGSIDVGAFARLRFFVHGGSAGGQQLRLNIGRGGAVIGNVEVDTFVSGGAIAAGQWREVVIPLAATTPPVTGTFDRIDLQSDQAAPQPTLFVDAVSLLPPAAPSGITGGGAQTLAVGATPQPIGLACVRGTAATTATVSCTEFDTPTNALRLREWPVFCPGGLAARYSANPRPNSVLASYRSLNQDFVAATLAITNTGNATLDLANCVFNPAGGFGLAGPTTLLAGQSGTLTLSCGTPPIGTTVSAFFSCQTNDPDLATVLYRADCVAPPLANAGSGASPLPRLSSPIINPGALLGTATSAAATAQSAEVVAVGAPNGGGDGNGRVYVFVRAPGALGKSGDPGDETLGDPVAVLAPPPGNQAKGAAGDKFGAAVSVAPGGTVIAVGAPDAGTAESGSVFVYSQPPGGWGDLGNQVPIAIDPPGIVGVDGFGASVQFDSAGLLVIGAPASDVGGAVDSGAAFVFRFTGSTWVQAGPMLTATGAPAGAAFGSAIDADAGRLAIGAPGEAAETGAVYAYGVDASGASGAARVTAPGGEVGDKWGGSVSVGGGLLAVGAPGDNTSAGTDSGSVSLLTLGGPGSAPQFASLLMPEAGVGQAAGTSVATNGNVVLVGAPLADTSAGNDSGRAYAYALPDLLAPMETADGFYDNAIGGGGDRFGSAIAIGARRAIIGAPFGNEGNDADEGRADPFLLDGVFRSGVER